MTMKLDPGGTPPTAATFEAALEERIQRKMREDGGGAARAARSRGSSADARGDLRASLPPGLDAAAPRHAPRARGRRRGEDPLHQSLQPEGAAAPRRARQRGARGSGEAAARGRRQVDLPWKSMLAAGAPAAREGLDVPPFGRGGLAARAAGAGDIHAKLTEFRFEEGEETVVASGEAPERTAAKASKEGKSRHRRRDKRGELSKSQKTDLRASRRDKRGELSKPQKNASAAMEHQEKKKKLGLRSSVPTAGLMASLFAYKETFDDIIDKAVEGSRGSQQDDELKFDEDDLILTGQKRGERHRSHAENVTPTHQNAPSAVVRGGERHRSHAEDIVPTRTSAPSAVVQGHGTARERFEAVLAASGVASEGTFEERMRRQIRAEGGGRGDSRGPPAAAKPPRTSRKATLEEKLRQRGREEPLTQMASRPAAAHAAVPRSGASRPALTRRASFNDSYSDLGAASRPAAAPAVVPRGGASRPAFTSRASFNDSWSDLGGVLEATLRATRDPDDSRSDWGGVRRATIEGSWGDLGPVIEQAMRESEETSAGPASWACAACTYRNIGKTDYCGACGTARQDVS